MICLPDMRFLSVICSLAASVAFLTACEPVSPTTSGGPKDTVEGPTVTALPVIPASDMSGIELEAGAETGTTPAETQIATVEDGTAQGQLNADQTVSETTSYDETDSTITTAVDADLEKDEDSAPSSSDQDESSPIIAETDEGPASPDITVPETAAPETLVSETIVPEQGTTKDAETGSATDSSEPPTEDTTQQLAMVQPAPPPPPPPPELAPATLLGVEVGGLLARLGAADLLRREGSMEVWQYQLSGCVVDFYIYPTADGRHITHWDWRVPTIGSSLDMKACRQQLAARDSGSQS